MLYSKNLPIGPFNFLIKTNVDSIKDNIELVYEDYTHYDDAELIDFPINIMKASGLRRFYHPQVNFFFDEFKPFKPLPLDQGYPMLEWGMNWCIASYAHQFLIFHSAVIEKENKAIIMPAPPGSGKSTLCAAMSFNGWRLFSDELGLISLNDGLAYPCTRPINLKNDSIKIIDDYIESAVFSRISYDTHKGTVALLKPPADSVNKSHLSAKPHAIVFPKYKVNSGAKIKRLKNIEVFSKMIENSFNFKVLGKDGFLALSSLLSSIQCYQLEYSCFEQAQSMLEELLNDE